MPDTPPSVPPSVRPSVPPSMPGSMPAVPFEGFAGTHYPMLDEKGRVIVPAKFRDALRDGLALTYGQEKCLYLYTRARYGLVFERAAAASELNETSRAYQRMVLANAQIDELDKQGRIVISKDLRRYAGLTRELAVLGVGNRIEIWDAARWQAYRDAQEAAFAVLSRDDPLPGQS